MARDFAVTDWLTVISRYFSGNPDEGSNLIRKGFVAFAILMLYTGKINPIFSDIQSPIFDFAVAALNMMNFEGSYIFPDHESTFLLLSPSFFLEI